LGSEKRISNKIPDYIEKLKKKVDDIKIKKLKVVEKQDYELAAKLRDEERDSRKKYVNEKEKWEKSCLENKIPITIDDVYKIITQITGVPITKLDNEESKKLLDLENILSTQVIGQNDAISSISKSIRRNRVGIKDANKPIGSYIFIGSSGVGKCVTKDTLVNLRNKYTGEQFLVSIEVFLNNILPKSITT